MPPKNKAAKFWNFAKNSANPAAGELYLYGVISGASWWGDEVTPKQFKTDLDALGDIQQLDIYINSDGGDVFAGHAIHAMLRRHSAHKIVHIDGVAASIASVVAMAGDEIIMPRNAMMMIHNPWTIAMGNADEFRKMADDLDKIRESIVAAYEDRTKLPHDEIVAIMDAETWLTADECVEKGFADKVDSEKQVAASLDGGFLVLNEQKFDLSQFKNAPKLMFVPTPRARNEPAEPPDNPAEPLKTDLKSLFECQIQINKNAIGGMK